MIMLARTALTFTAFFLGLGTAMELPSPLLVTYWGQGPNSSLQKPLRSYCDLGYNGMLLLARKLHILILFLIVVVLGFINQFGNDTFNMQMDSVSCSTGATSGCAVIERDIAYCQSKYSLQ